MKQTEISLPTKGTLEIQYSFKLLKNHAPPHTMTIESVDEKQLRDLFKKPKELKGFVVQERKKKNGGMPTTFASLNTHTIELWVRKTVSFSLLKEGGEEMFSATNEEMLDKHEFGVDILAED